MPFSEYTRTYRLSTFRRVFMRFLGCLTVGFSLVMFRMVSSSPANSWHRNSIGMMALIFVSSFFLVGGFLEIRIASKAAVVLTQDELESIGIWGRRTMRLSDISGRRATRDRTIILPCNGKEGKLIIHSGLGFVFDDFYRAWLATVPDLDAIDRDRQHLARESDLVLRRKAGKLRFYEKWMGLEKLPYDGSYIPASTSPPNQKNDKFSANEPPTL